MVPVNLRSEAEANTGGNHVGSVLCNLGTDIEDPERRLHTIATSMRGNKKVLGDLPRLEVLALSGLMIAPLGWARCRASSEPHRRRSTSSSRTCPDHASRCTGTAPG